MENSNLTADSTVRSQDSNNSNDSKETKISKMSDESGNSSSKDSSKPESCLESKHSKDQLIETPTRRHHHHHHHHNNNNSNNNSQQSNQHQQQQQIHMTQHQQHQQMQLQQQQRETKEIKDDSNILMFTSCGQLLLGIVLVVFGILTLVHGASLSGSGAGIWSGVGALSAGALGVVATLASSTGEPLGPRRPSSFSSAHLAASLIALALSNLSTILALTAVVRDAQRSPPDVALIELPADEDVQVEEGWAGLLSSIGLLVASIFELLVSGYTCFNLTPKLCDCLRKEDATDIEEMIVDGKPLKTRNMVQQWVIAQNHVPKNQPIYVVQPIMPVHPLMQAPYGMHPGGPPPGKYATGFPPVPPQSAAAAAAYGMLPAHVAYPARPPSQIMRAKQPKKRRHSSDQSDSGGEPRQRRSSQQHRSHSSSPDEQRHGRKPMAVIGEDQLQQDLARTYTGLDKRISEEFIAIAMDPERKSKASSHHGSEIAAAAATTSRK